MFIETLLSVINIPYTSHSEDVIVFSDWKRKFEVHFTGNFKSKEILKISYKRADVLQADFPFNNQNATKLVMSNFVKAEFQRIQRTIPILIEINEDWLFLDMIIDELILRNLRTRISPNELEDILKIKDIVHLPFYAISDQIIYFTSFRDEPYPGRSFVRLHLDSNYNIDELMSGLDQSTTERILSIKRSYLTALAIYISNVGNPKTLFKTLNNFDRIDKLYLSISFLEGEGVVWNNNQVVDYSALEHLHVRNLYLSANFRTSRNSKIINLQLSGQLNELVLYGIDLPDITKWSINLMIIKENARLSSFDFLPEQLQELQVYYIHLPDIVKRSKKVYSNVQKLIIIRQERFFSNETILADFNVRNFITFYPNAIIDFREENIRRSYFSDFLGLIKEFR